MNGIDIAIAGILLFFAIRGFIKGFLLGLASLAGLVLGVYAAYHFSDYTRELMEGQTSIPPEYIKLIAFMLTFIVVLLFIHLIARLIEKIVTLAGLSFLNKLAGLALGLVKGGLITGVFIYFFCLIGGREWVNQKTLDNSLLFEPTLKIATFVMNGFHLTLHENRTMTEPEEELPMF
jgi:membrane protein required for colicin V production